MLYSTRFRIKESLNSQDLAKVNQILDTKVIPATLKVDGVRSFVVQQSSNGELVALLDVQDLATVDRILTDEGCRAVFGELQSLTMRTGGEILFDRPQWQKLYGN